MSALSRFSKKITGSSTARSVLARLADFYIRLVWVSGRWDVSGIEHRDKLLDSGEGFLVAFWHGRLMMMPKCWQMRQPVHMIVSEHRDGELIAKTIAHHKIQWIKGSTSKGGSKALRRAITVLKRGEVVGITPDGPRGPRMRVSDGVIQLARLSGAPILPATFGIRCGKLMSSWDRFLLPLPFSRGQLVFGAPLHIPKDSVSDDLEIWRVRLEDAMNNLVVEADTLTGREPVKPANVPAKDAA